MIHLESWYKEALDQDVARLLQELLRTDDLGAWAPGFQAFRRLGKEQDFHKLLARLPKEGILSLPPEILPSFLSLMSLFSPGSGLVVDSSYYFPCTQYRMLIIRTLVPAPPP